jgi:hypothetical protein
MTAKKVVVLFLFLVYDRSVNGSGNPSGNEAGADPPGGGQGQLRQAGQEGHQVYITEPPYLDHC